MPVTANKKSDEWSYGIVLDAGSSGTRLYVYRWLKNSLAREKLHGPALQSLPEIKTKKKWTQKTKPGVSTFAANPKRVGPDHLHDLFETAKSIVPESAAEETPIFLLATAGMRLLSAAERGAILKEICTYAQTTTRFLITDCAQQIRVIPGNTEGLYGWIAANYLLGGFDPPPDELNTDPRTFGFLDMGGASAQIAFAPNSTEAARHPDDLTLVRMRHVNGEMVEHRVFSTTWLRFGVHEARSRYVEALEKARETASTKELLDPCLPSGLKLTPEGDKYLPDDRTIDGKKLFLKGTGDFETCLTTTQPLLGKDMKCEIDPCPVAGVHVPAIDFDVNHFVGVSEYWHTTHEIFELDKAEKAYDLNTYQQRVLKFCSQSWTEILAGVEQGKWGDKVDETRAAEACFKASWLINLLHEGIGVPRIGLEETSDPKHSGTSKLLKGAKSKGFAENFRPINKIDDTEVSWTLGKVVLYASSQIKPMSTADLPVGFGSNEAGVPADFEFPGTRGNMFQTGNDTTQTASHTLPKSENSGALPTKASRRIPGIVIFLLLISLIIYWLWSRIRRTHGSLAMPSKGGRAPLVRQGSSLASKLRNLLSPASHHIRYERVDIEDGDLAAPETYELGGYSDEGGSSDSSNGSRAAARASGRSTPRVRKGLSLAEQSSNGFDGLGSGSGLGIGLEGSAMDRSGLIGRVESRERLSGLSEPGHQSRTGSPARHSASRLGRMV